MHRGLILSVLHTHTHIHTAAAAAAAKQSNGANNDDETFTVVYTLASILRPLTSMMRKCIINAQINMNRK